MKIYSSIASDKTSLILAAFSAFLASALSATAMDCRILSLSQAGSLVWTNSHTNVYAGFQYAERLGDPWQPTPPPFWNFLLTSHSNQFQLPAEGMSMGQLYLRLVMSTNDLGSGFPIYQVPQRALVVDGNTNDWLGLSPAIVDPAGDGNPLRGSDITALFIARDNQNIYARFDLADGPPSSELYFAISFTREDEIGIRFIFVQLNQLRCSVDEWVDDEDFYHIPVATGVMAVNQSVIELSVPASSLNAPSPSFISTWNDTASQSIDETIMIEARYE